LKKLFLDAWSCDAIGNGTATQSIPKRASNAPGYRTCLQRRQPSAKRKKLLFRVSLAFDLVQKFCDKQIPVFVIFFVIQNLKF